MTIYCTCVCNSITVYSSVSVLPCTQQISTDMQVKKDRNHGSTNLVHLTVGSIANYLHQLKDSCWVLEKKTTW